MFPYICLPFPPVGPYQHYPMNHIIRTFAAAVLSCMPVFAAEAQNYNRNLSQEALEQASAFQDAQDELSRLGQHLDRCRDLYDTAKENFDRISDHCQSVERRNEDQIYRCRREIEEAKNNVLSLKSSSAVIKNDIKADKASIKTRQAAVKSHKKSLKAAGSLDRSGDLYLDQMQSEIRVINQNIDLAKSQQRRISADIKTENEFIKSSNGKIKNCKSELKAVKSELKDAKKSLQASKKDLANAEKVFADARKKTSLL